MEEKKKLQRIRMLSALGDFQLALSAADFLQEADEETTYSHVALRRFRCYEHTAIISYTRPFSQSKGAIPKLSLKQCGIKLTESEARLHDRVLTLRNKLVAHTDHEMMNFAAKAFAMSESVGTSHAALFTQHDEGLQFYRFSDQCQFISLIRRVSFNLYTTLHNLAQADPLAFNLQIHYPITK